MLKTSNKKSFSKLFRPIETSSSTMTERPRDLGDFKGVGQFEAKLYVEALRFAPIPMDH